MNQKRLLAYVDEEDHRKLRAKLALMGKTIKQWIREQVKEFIKD